MRREWNLIRELALYIEEHEPVRNSLDLESDDHSDTAVEEHLRMMNEAGWINGLPMDYIDDDGKHRFVRYDIRLTEIGRSFAESVRDADAWLGYKRSAAETASLKGWTAVVSAVHGSPSPSRHEIMMEITEEQVALLQAVQNFAQGKGSPTYEDIAKATQKKLDLVIRNFTALKDGGYVTIRSAFGGSKVSLTGRGQQVLLNPNYGRSLAAPSISTPFRSKPTTPTQKIVLAVFSSPNDLQFLSRLEAERKRFEDVLSFSQEYLYFSISPHKDALVRELNNKPPYLFHYSGHAQAAGIALHKEASGETEFILWQGLGQLLARFRDTLQVVVLNGCQTVAPEFFRALGNNRPTVIATTGDILDKDASQFTSIFYEYLAKGRTPRKAFEIAFDTFALTNIAAAERYQFFNPHDPI